MRSPIRNIRDIRGSEKSPNFPRKISPGFLQYIGEWPEMTSRHEETKKAKTRKGNYNMKKFTINKTNPRVIIAGGLISAAILLLALALPVGPARAAGGDDYRLAQIAQLYELQAAFHRAASVHSLTGDSLAVINQRIEDMLALWTDNGVVFLDVPGNPHDGYYRGKGDLVSNCSPPSGDPNNQGTLCTFFKYVAGSFQPQNIFVSLAPSYKTHFELFGTRASVYFECHYFNVAGSPPAWTAASHVAFDGSARLVNGQWLFSFAHVPVAPVPIP
jgi:hypothetical protein